MSYFYLFFPFIVWVISQTIKFFIRLTRKRVPTHLKSFLWMYIWAGGTPSTHTAILTSSLYLVWKNFGFSAIFTFCLVITMLWLYDMATARKRQELMDDYFNDSSTSLKKIVSDGYILDLAGHTVQEIIWGAVLGVILGVAAASRLL